MIGENRVRQAIDFIEGPVQLDTPIIYFNERQQSYFVSCIALLLVLYLHIFRFLQMDSFHSENHQTLCLHLVPPLRH